MKSTLRSWVLALGLLALGCGGGSASDNGNLNNPTVTGLTVTPALARIHSGENLQFVATATVSDGRSGNIASLANWTSSNLNAASIVANSGLATGQPLTVVVPAVSSTISAALGGLSANATLKVVPPIGTIQPFSTGISPSSGPAGICLGPDGNLWFTEILGNRIGRLNPSNGAITEFTGIADQPGKVGLQPSVICAGPDGNLWFTVSGANRIGRITTAGIITEFTTGLTANAFPYGICAGPDGNLWFAEFDGNRIGRITPAGVITEFSTGISAGSFPCQICSGPDGNLWFTEYAGNRIGRITTAGVVTEFSNGLTGNPRPFGICPGPDGNLWFVEDTGSGVGKITTSGVITEFFSGITPGCRPNYIATGPDGNLWFTETDAGLRVGRITPAGVVTEFPNTVPNASVPAGICAGPDGNLWFTDFLEKVNVIVP